MAHTHPRIIARLLDDPPMRVVAPVGEHDVATERGLSTILAAATAMAEPVIVDLRRTTFADASVLRAIISADAAARPRSLAVVLPQRGEVVRLFDLTEAGTLLPAFASLPQAVAWCHGAYRDTLVCPRGPHAAR